MVTEGDDPHPPPTHPPTATNIIKEVVKCMNTTRLFSICTSILIIQYQGFCSFAPILTCHKSRKEEKRRKWKARWEGKTDDAKFVTIPNGVQKTLVHWFLFINHISSPSSKERSICFVISGRNAKTCISFYKTYFSVLFSFFFPYPKWFQI